MALVRVSSAVPVLLVTVGIAAALIVCWIPQQVTADESEGGTLTASSECLLFGWVNSSATMEGIDGASILAMSLELDIMESESNETGYYEMMLWRGPAIVLFDAPLHEPYIDVVDLTGLTEHRMDVLLESEPTIPTAEMTVNPDSDISIYNPLTAHVVCEDYNLAAAVICAAYIHNGTGDWINFTSVDIAGVGFSEYGDFVIGDLDYTHQGDVFEGDYNWAASTMTDSGYLFSEGESEYMINVNRTVNIEGVSYGIPGYYTNSTLDMEEGFAWFDNETGEYTRFQFVNLTGFEQPDLPDALPEDAEGVMAPVRLVETWKMGTQGTEEFNDWYEFGLAKLDARSTLGMRFEYSSTVPSGDYIVVLLTMDQANNYNWTEQLITVDTDPPIADAGEDMTVAPGTSTTLCGGDSDDNVGIVNYTWSFDDDGAVVLYGETVVHSFVESGQHTITLTVRDGGLNENQDTAVVQVDDEPPVAEAGPAEITVPEDVPTIFDGSDSSDDSGIADYSWEIVELGEVSTDSIFTFTFDQPGTYHVELTVVDVVGHVSDTDSIIVIVTDETAPIADAGTDVSTIVGLPVVLDGSGSSDNVGIDNYTWWLTTGSEYWEFYESTNEVVFDLPGTYVVNLEVSDEAGNSDNDTLTIQVLEPPVADAGEDQDVRTGDLVQLDASGSRDDEGIQNYTWTFEYDGDTVHLYGETVEFTFDIAGTYDVNLTVIDGAGLKAYDEIEITVTTKSAGATLVLIAVGSVVALAAVAVLAILAMKRKKS